MRLDHRNRRRLRLQNLLFVVLVLAFVGILAWLAQSWRYTADWTQTARNTLTTKSHEVIELVEGPVEMTVYLGPQPVTRRSIRDLVERYRRAGVDVKLEFVNPETNPALARELGIRQGGELIVRHGGREERLQRISEQSITSALARLARDAERWVVFLEGHGERKPHGEGNADLGGFGERLRERGFRVQTLQLARMPHIPDNTDLLVIASPQSDYLPGELARVRQYVQAGGHLLWLTEPEHGDRLNGLAEDLGIRRHEGVVVDAGAQLFGTDTPDFAVISDYGDHPVVDGLDQLSLFPQAVALTPNASGGWRHSALLRTREQSWTETGPIEGEIDFDRDAGETRGPLTLGWAGRRGPPAEGDEPPTGGQRFAVIGDGDFLSNAYIGNGVNLDLGMRLVNWLVGDRAHISIPPDVAPDTRVDLSRTAVIVLGFGFLLILPLALLTTGLVIGWRRRRR
ncbi:GldG family protein [Halofilum ochraceum]|uniref:GldG family protein n=1 Tax=Halofilum ochraceum TaxID=1611323 RepID=UPI0008D97A6D|nr:GldG family protein [Halofilum ochraceum]